MRSTSVSDLRNFYNFKLRLRNKGVTSQGEENALDVFRIRYEALLNHLEFWMGKAACLKCGQVPGVQNVSPTFGTISHGPVQRANANLQLPGNLPPAKPLCA
jgi:hypothetical protein